MYIKFLTAHLQIQPNKFVMKKLQNYLVKPEQLRKKLQNPAFRHDFIQWSKSHLCGQSYSRQSKSRSPNENYKRNFDSQNSKVQQNRSKENIRPNTGYSSHHGLHSQQSSKKNFKIAIHDDLKSKAKNKSSKPVTHVRSHTHFHSFNHNKSSDDIANSSVRTIEHRDRSKNYSVNSIQNIKKTKDNLLVPKPKKNKESTQKKQLKMQFTYSYRTRQGVIATNPNKTNQDRLLIKTKIAKEDTHLFVVADGHGLNGHLVSQSLVNNMPKLFEKELEKKKVEEALPSVFDNLQKNLTDSEFNVSCSGSTLVSVILESNHITCANVGDSRAILARQVDKKSWEMIYLSQDHKPSIESQKKRILKQGGRVHSLKDEKGQSVGPLRVWLPNQNIQGLAMSRSLGDNVSKPYGVTHRPQIIKIGADKRDKFILLASDGVWEFLTNQEVLQLIVPFYRERKLEEACDALLKLAYERWTVEDTSVVDDITFILIFLNHQ